MPTAAPMEWRTSRLRKQRSSLLSSGPNLQQIIPWNIHKKKKKIKNIQYKVNAILEKNQIHLVQILPNLTTYRTMNSTNKNKLKVTFKRNKFKDC